MTVNKALELMRRDLGRNVKLIKSARLPYDTLIVMAESTTDIPEMGSTMHEVRMSVFVAGHPSTSIIVDSDFIKKEAS